LNEYNCNILNRFNYHCNRSGTKSPTIDYIKKQWTELYPGFPFDYTFLYEDFGEQFKADEKRGIIIASIVSWYLARDWLESFVYRTGIEWISFVLAGLVMLVITGLTVSYHTIRSANVNPAESLKYE